MSGSRFKRVGKSQKPMYGKRCVLVCGFSVSQRKIILDMLEKTGLKAIPVVFAIDEDQDATLKEMLSRRDRAGMNNECRLEPAIILSGFTEKELHQVLNAYRGLDLPRPFWATLTPVSENWPLKDLLSELKRERMAMETRQK